MNTTTFKVKNFYHLNQFVINDDDNFKIYFQSYDSLICEIDYYNKTIRIYENRDYSKTTLKHFYAFLKEYLSMNIDRKTLLKIKDKKIDSFYNGYNIVFDENVKDFEKSLID